MVTVIPGQVGRIQIGTVGHSYNKAGRWFLRTCRQETIVQDR
jgi:hypothetical protein